MVTDKQPIDKNNNPKKPEEFLVNPTMSNFVLLDQISRRMNKLIEANKAISSSVKELKLGQQAINKGLITTNKYEKYYDISNTILVATATDPGNQDDTIYQQERVYEALQRNASILNVANDGTSNLFVRIGHGGTQTFSPEQIIYPGDVKTYYNVYELRLRSPLAGLPYRVSEYEIETFPTAYIAKLRPLTCEDHVDVCNRSDRLLGITQGNAPTSPSTIYTLTPGLGAGSSIIVNYVATGNFRLSAIEASSAGALKIEVKAGNIGLETTKLVAFTTETNLTAQLKFYESLALTTGQRLQIFITNRELQATDVYSTIFGFYV